jgi:hypothetical protein
MARPMPRVPPVTAAILPASDSINQILREPRKRAIEIEGLTVRIESEMLPSASESPVREILQSRLSNVLPELESALRAYFATEVACAVDRVSGEARESAWRELADRLNQAARRILHAQNAEETVATLVEAAAGWCGGAALVRVEDSIAHGERVRGVSEECATSFADLAIPLSTAPALAEAVRSRDPVTAIAASGEISAELTNLAGQGRGERVFLYPVVAGERVPAVLCVWGEVQGSAVELLTQIAAAALRALPQPAELVRVSPPLTAGEAATLAQRPTWDALSQEEQQIHLKAQRTARVSVAEIRLFEGEAVESGRAHRDLYDALRSRIEAARESFHKTFFSATPTMVDYLHLELLGTLAHDDPDLLGKDYPGPLV